MASSPTRRSEGKPQERGHSHDALCQVRTGCWNFAAALPAPLDAADNLYAYAPNDAAFV